MEALYIFHHVPKCGGTTVSRIIDRIYDPSVIYAVNSLDAHHETSLRALRQMEPESISKLRMIRGRDTYGLHRIFDRPCKYIAVLREPARRFISSYFQALRNNGPLARRLRESSITLKQLAESDDEFFGRDYLVRSFAAVPEASDFVNGTTLLELAKHNISTDFVAVGIAERMEESILLFSELIHWKIRGYRNHNVGREYHINEIDPEVLTVFRQRNPNDVAFYQFALSLFENQIQRVPLFAEKLEHFRYTNSTYNRWQDRIARLKKPLRAFYRCLSSLQHE